MNCAKHTNTVAVAACDNCGAGICSECVDQTEYRIDNKPLCRNCNYNLINNLIRDDKKQKTWTIVKLALNALFLAVGLLCLFGNGDAAGGIFFAAIGGLPTAWKLLKRSPEEKFRDALDDHAARVTGGVGDSMIQSAMRFIIRIILTFIFGAIAAPVLLIISIVKLVKCTKRIKENEEMLVNFA